MTETLENNEADPQICERPIMDMTPTTWAEVRLGPGNLFTPGSGMPITSKISSYISVNEFFRLYDAVQFANSCGWLMNVELTVAYQASDAQSLKAFRSFISRYRSWCEHHDVPCAYIYVWERPPNTPLHVHLHLHIPNRAQSKARAWLKLTLGVSTSSPVASIGLDVRQPKDVVSQWIWFRYINKGIEPHISSKGDETCERYKFARQLGIRGIAQGQILFKRTGRSLQISDTAQQDAAARREFHLSGLMSWETPFEEIWSDYWFLQFTRRLQAANLPVISRLF
ncbi:hypothetical protein [Mesorhizobium sp. M0589]|uniref:rolling circle replication-associated protein n=1 Tax=Mesorhizobium sp. M0589 TaxID=2956965 RepID=UPI003339DBE6